MNEFLDNAFITGTQSKKLALKFSFASKFNCLCARDHKFKLSH